MQRDPPELHAPAPGPPGDTSTPPSLPPEPELWPEDDASDPDLDTWAHDGDGDQAWDELDEGTAEPALPWPTDDDAGGVELTDEPEEPNEDIGWALEESGPRDEP